MHRAEPVPREPVSGAPVSDRTVRRRGRRAIREGAPGADPAPLRRPASADEPERATEDTDAVWGDRTGANDEELKRNVPPHW